MIAVFQAEINRYQRQYNAKAYEAEINTAKNNDAYQDLVAYQIAYDSKKESLATQMEFLKNTLDSFKSARKEDVKRESTFWCFG